MWPILFLALFAQAPDFISEGLKALDAGNSSAAVESFRKAIAADPADYSAHFNLGLAYSMSNQDAQAIPEYKKTLELRPGLYEAQLNLSMSLLNAKDPDGAIPFLKAAEEQRPKEFKPVYYLGTALLETKQFAEAVAAFQKAVEIDAASAGAELGLGQALARQGHRNEADPHYRKASNLDHSYQSFLLELATLYEEHGELPQALDIYREFPDDPGAQERSGVLLLRTGQSAAAIAALEPVVAKSPTPANQIALAQAYVKEKQLAKADPLAAKGVAAAQDDFELRMFYARILRDERKFPLASEQFSAATKLKPDSPQAWTELAGVLIMAEQPLEGLAALDKVRDLGAETSGHFYLRAITLDRLKKNKEALESYNKFLAASQNVNPDQEFIARQRVKVLEKELGEEVSMFLLLTLMLALDLTGIKAEPRLEKRSQLALQFADSSLDSARELYKKGDVDACRTALGEVEAGVELSYDSLVATGKDPRRNSGPFKEAEKSTRQILRRLESLSDLMSAFDRGAVEPVQHTVSDIHDKLIVGIMGKKK